MISPPLYITLIVPYPSPSSRQRANLPIQNISTRRPTPKPVHLPPFAPTLGKKDSRPWIQPRLTKNSPAISVVARPTRGRKRFFNKAGRRLGAQCVDGYCTYTTRPLVRSQAVDGRGGGEWKGVYRGGGGARERKGGQSRTEKYSIYWISTWATITSVSFDLSIAGPRFDGKRMISWGREERKRKEWQVSMDVSWAWLIRDDNRLLSKQRRR